MARSGPQTISSVIYAEPVIQSTFDKEKLLMKAQKERRKREEIRQRLRSAQVIQASVRSFLSRQHLKRRLRTEFDSNIAQNASREFNMENMKSNLRLLMFFHSPKLDAERLTWFGKKLIKEKTKWISNDDRNLSSTLKVLRLSCKSIRSAGLESNIAIPLRIVETFTDYELLDEFHQYNDDDAILKMWNDLIDIGYFKGILKLMSTRVPFDIEPQFDRVRAPTPLAETLLTLLVRPITLAANIGGSKVSSTSLLQNSIMKSFVREVVLVCPSTQLYYFVHPALGAMHALPVQLFVKCTCELLESRSSGLPAMLGSLSRIVHPRLEFASLSCFSEYLRCVRYFVVHLPTPPNPDPDSDDDSDSETEEMEYQLSHSQEDCVSTSELVRDSESVLSSELFVDFVVDKRIYESHSNETLDSICAICDHLIAVKKVNVQKSKLLRTLAFSATFLRQLWNSLMTLCTKSGITGKSVPLVQLLIEGRSMSLREESSLRSKLVVFCALFNLNLLAVPDTDFYSGAGRRMTFSLPNLASIAALMRDVCLSVIKMTLPETRSQFGKYDIRSALKALSTGRPVKSDGGRKSDDAELDMRNKFIHLFRICRSLVKHLHTRDSRRAFIAKGSWLSNSIVIGQSNDLANRWYRRYGNENSVAAHLANSSDEDIVLSVNEARQLAVLTNMPFVVPFDARVSIFMTMLQKERSGRENARERAIVEAGLASSTMTNEVKVRREFLYEDAFNDLSPENAPNLRKRLRVQFVNAMGLDEVGYGAGVTREFMQQVIKAGFDPTRGIFKSTAQGRLYPNPHAALVMQNADQHFFFLGRMLGKIMDEGMQVELPFASFFLCKILQRKSADVDINHLQSLDPDFYKNLMYLHDYEGDVSDLGLNFTVVDEALGVTRVTELVQNGKNISVTNKNKDMYMHLMANYKLNVQMRAPCYHFRRGLEDVVNVDWLQMFDHEEIQTLIAGAEVPIDMEDLKSNTVYSAGYTADHPTIVAFWQVLPQLSNQQLSQFLLFVTSCSRPPLLGFKELDPPFCIQRGGDEDRLPSASTCVNLLKLPEYTDTETLKAKLLYCLQSQSGFELS